MFGLPVEQQLFVFLYFYVAGILAGFVFDFFKALVKTFRFSRKVIFLLDLLLCLLGALIIFFILYLTNYGEVRFFIFLALMFGIFFYYIICSSFIYKQISLLFGILRIFILRIKKIFKILQDFASKIKNYLRRRLLTCKVYRGKQ